MPAGKSKYTYRRTTADSKPVFDGRKSDKKFNTWVRADVPGKQEGTAGKPGSYTAKGLALQPSAAAAPSIPQQPTVLPGYTQQGPHQLRRLQDAATVLPAASATTSAQPKLAAPAQPAAKHGTGLPSSAVKQSLGSLVHRGKHSLVRPSSSIISAVARTVAAVKSPRSLRAAHKWSRASPQGLPNPATLKAIRSSLRKGTPLARAGAAAYLKLPVARKAAFKWARDQPGKANALIPGSSTGARWQQSHARRPRPGPERQGLKTSRAKPAKLVRIDGTLYRVSGIGAGRSLKRQVTPKTLPRKPSSGQPMRYQRVGNSLQRLSAGSPAVQPGRVRAGTLRRLRQGVAAKRVLLPASASRLKPDRKAAQLGVVSRIRRRTTFVNRPCPRFCRTGKCAEKDAGTCSLVHDPEKVAVCSKWLQGRCEAPNCLLQHRRRPQLMPLCEHFLHGTCKNLDCPYLHVLLDEKAPICKDFTNGYCGKGASCLKKHLSSTQVTSLRATKRLSLKRKVEEVKETLPRKRRRWPLPVSEIAAAAAKAESAYVPEAVGSN